MKRIELSHEPRFRPLTLLSPREEKIGETLDFEPRKIHTQANNLGRIVVVSPNAETVSGRFCGNPSVSVMTPPLRSPTVAADPKTIRHRERVFRPKQWELGDHPIGLNFYRVLIQKRPRAIKDAAFSFRMFFIRFISSFVVFDDLRLPHDAPCSDSPRRRAGPGAAAIGPSTDPIQHGFPTGAHDRYRWPPLARTGGARLP